MSIPVELACESVTSHLYKDKSYFLKNGSFLFYGFVVKNKYDEERLKICSHLTPIRFKHELYDYSCNEVKINYYYGVKLQGNKKFSKLCKSLEPVSTDYNKFLKVKDYRRLFSEFNVETKDTFLYYSVGVYPFDNISDLHNGIINSELFFLDNNVPWYQKITSIKPFIFCRTNDECN